MKAFCPRRCVYFPHLHIHYWYSFYILGNTPILLCECAYVAQIVLYLATWNSHLVPMSPWHTSTIMFFFFNCNFLALTQFQALWNASGSSCTGPAPRFVKSNISPSTSSYFHLKMVFETKIWTLSVFFAAGGIIAYRCSHLI